ncbi:MAG: ABC transporter transmembrane domain-containing protein, partial [Pseudomonadota bacterium]
MASNPSHPEHRSLREVLSSARSVFVTVGLFSLATNLLMLAVPLYMMQLFDRVLATRNVDTLIALTIIVLVSILVMGALESVRSRLMVRCGTGIERRLAPEVLEYSARAARRGNVGAEPGGQSLRDLAAVRSYLGGPAVMSIFDAPYVPVFLAVVFLIHALLGWIALGGALLLFGLAYANEQYTRPPVQEGNRESARALNEADAALRNFDVIEALGMMDALKRRWRSAGGRALAYHEEASDRGSLISASARVLRLTIQVAMLGTGAWLAMSDAISGGAMIAASIIAGRALAPFEQSISGWKMLIGAQQAFARVRDLLQREFVPGDAMTLPEPEGRLSVEGLIYVPRGSAEPVLRDINFELAPGTSLGIIGPSAAGKTTLVRHLVGPARAQTHLNVVGRPYVT